MKTYKLSKDQLNYLLLNFTGWNGYHIDLMIVNEKDMYDYDGAGKLKTEPHYKEKWEDLNSKLKDGEVIVSYEKESLDDDKLCYVRELISEYEKDIAKDYTLYYNVDYNNLLLLEKLLANK